ncbi:hypothetical protein NQZ68_020284 [Dissostichus eleginoides]|nr:hypothetical protein NQZ68_020284 [Dissostichus eleginoides]
MTEQVLNVAVRAHREYSWRTDVVDLKSFSSAGKSMFNSTFNNLRNQELHLCAFISFHLNNTERNYNIRSQEVLAVRQTVEERKTLTEGYKTSLALKKPRRR